MRQPDATSNPLRPGTTAAGLVEHLALTREQLVHRPLRWPARVGAVGERDRSTTTATALLGHLDLLRELAGRCTGE